MRRCRISLPNRCQRLISRAEWHTVRLKGASGESEVLRRYDKENILWQFTVAIRSDPVGSGRGARFSASEPLFVQALHYDWETLAYSRHINGQRRMNAVPVPSDDVLLNLDVRQTGLGGASCGPGPMAKYRFDPKATVEWTLKIERIGK